MMMRWWTSSSVLFLKNKSQGPTRLFDGGVSSFFLSFIRSGVGGVVMTLVPTRERRVTGSAAPEAVSQGSLVSSDTRAYVFFVVGLGDGRQARLSVCTKREGKKALSVREGAARRGRSISLLFFQRSPLDML